MVQTALRLHWHFVVLVVILTKELAWDKAISDHQKLNV